MEGESRVLAGEIWVATALTEQALADDVADSAEHRAFKATALRDWISHRIPLHEAVQNDLFICVFRLLPLFLLCDLESFDLNDRLQACHYLIRAGASGGSLSQKLNIPLRKHVSAICFRIFSLKIENR